MLYTKYNILLEQHIFKENISGKIGDMSLKTLLISQTLAKPLSMTLENQQT